MAWLALGLGTPLIVLVGWLFYSGMLDRAAWIGMGMIVGGVLVINLFSANAGSRLGSSCQT